MKLNKRTDSVGEVVGLQQKKKKERRMLELSENIKTGLRKSWRVADSVSKRGTNHMFIVTWKLTNQGDCYDYFFLVMSFEL